MRGIRRTFGTARVKKAPAIAAKMRSMVALAPDSLTGLRDRALLLIGFAGAFRRSQGSKTDQERQGETIAIARGDVACPVKALQAWLEASGIEAGQSSGRSTKAARCGARD
jgi:hypothetical protein